MKTKRPRSRCRCQPPVRAVKPYSITRAARTYNATRAPSATVAWRPLAAGFPGRPSRGALAGLFSPAARETGPRQRSRSASASAGRRSTPSLPSAPARPLRIHSFFPSLSLSPCIVYAPAPACARVYRYDLARLACVCAPVLLTTAPGALEFGGGPAAGARAMAQGTRAARATGAAACRGR